MSVGTNADGTVKTRPVVLQTMQADEAVALAQLNIPAWSTPPGIIVAGGRTFYLTPQRSGPTDPALYYIEATSYVVPDPGGRPESLKAKLERLAELEQFKAAVLDPLMQPSEHGTILTRIADALGGQTFSKTAGDVHRAQANSRL